MNFIKGSLYRHKSTIDIDIYIVRAIEHSNHWELETKYWNRHSKCFQPDAISTEGVIVQKDQLHLWENV